MQQQQLAQTTPENILFGLALARDSKLGFKSGNKEQPSSRRHVYF